MTYLGIDYGLKRIGVALAQDGAIFELAQIEEDDRYRQLEKVFRLLNEYEVESVIMGLPSSGSMKSKIIWFKNALEKKGVTVELMNEDLTSVQAMHELDQAKLKPSEKKRRTDSRSAVLIVQDYLETKA